MPTSLKRANGAWQIKVRLTGHPEESQVFDAKKTGMEWGYAREAELRKQTTGAASGTLQDAIDRYIKDVCPLHAAGDNEAKRLKALAGVAELLPVLRDLRKVRAADLAAFRDKRLAQVSVATVRKEMTILRSVLESARRDWGMLEVNPIADVKKPPAPPHRNRLFVGDELPRILEALGYQEGAPVATLQHQVAVALLLAFETGMRAGELLGLEWPRVFLSERYVRLPKTKNGGQRDVSLSRRAVALITMMQATRQGSALPVFTVTLASLDALFRKARDKCGIVNLHFHDSRANAVTALARKLRIEDLARMIGHRDIRSLQIYYRKTASDIADSLD